MGQYFDGVYLNDYKNAVVISSKDTILTGTIILGQTQRLPFFGSSFGKSFSGVVVTKEGESLRVKGTLSGDSLSLEIIVGRETTYEILIKISNNPKFNLDKYYSNPLETHDKNLIGKWVVVRLTDPTGRNIMKRRYQYEYLESGKLINDKNEVKALLNELNQGHAPLNLEVNIPDFEWIADGHKLIIKSEWGEMSETYRFQNDTLIITNERGGSEFLLRKIIIKSGISVQSAGVKEVY